MMMMMLMMVCCCWDSGQSGIRGKRRESIVLQKPERIEALRSSPASHPTCAPVLLGDRGQLRVRCSSEALGLHGRLTCHRSAAGAQRLGRFVDHVKVRARRGCGYTRQRRMPLRLRAVCGCDRLGMNALDDIGGGRGAEPVLRVVKHGLRPAQGALTTPAQRRLRALWNASSCKCRRRRFGERCRQSTRCQLSLGLHGASHRLDDLRLRALVTERCKGRAGEHPAKRAGHRRNGIGTRATARPSPLLLLHMYFLRRRSSRRDGVSCDSMRQIQCARRRRRIR